MPTSSPQAVIDIGTNTVILLIAKKKGKSIEVLEDIARITRLGQGVTNNHFFASEAMKRTKAVLGEFKAICDKRKIKKIKAVGTAAFRMATNKDVFLDAVADELKIKIQVISGEDEAEATFLAALRDFPKKKLIVVDIGGGSTEVITGPLTAKKEVPESVMSLPIGSVKLTEETYHSDPIKPDEFLKLEQRIQKEVRALNDLGEFDPEEYTLVATAGTATTLLAIDKELKTYSHSKIHGKPLSLVNLETIITRLRSLTLKQRQSLAGMEPLRADVILAGAVLLREIMRYFKKDEVLISDRGLRYGIFYEKFC